MHLGPAKIFAVLAAVTLLATPMLSVHAGQTLVLADGFESDSVEWNFGARRPGSSVEIVGDHARSGIRSARLTATQPEEPGQSVGLQSAAFVVPPWSRVEVSLWLKADNVVSYGEVKGDWYKLRINLAAFDQTGKRIRARDIASVTGSFPWKHVQGGMVAPSGTASMRLQVLLTTATGTVWVDDAEVHVVQELPASQPPDLESLAIVPAPWQARLTGETRPIGRVSVINDPKDARIFDHVDSVLRARRVQLSKAGEGQTGLYIGEGTSAELDRRFKQAFPEQAWADLGPQGYFLSVQPSGQNTDIFIGANTAEGQFYGLQTLKQLIHDGEIHLGDILDRPTLAHRGIVMGIQFFDQREQTPLRRLTELKFNTVWNQGSFLDGAFLDRWRQPLSRKQKRILREYWKLYANNFIDIWISIRPTGKNPPITYSSDKDIGAVVDKFGDLYELGFRNFALSFDDLENIGEHVLLSTEDKDIFGEDFAAAQKHFVEQVFERLTGRHPESRFSFLPMKYANPGNLGSAGQAYLNTFASLPPRIGITTVSEFDTDIEAVADLTDRPNTLWSNYYAEGYDDAPEFVVPFQDGISWDDQQVRAKIDQFLWLPMVPYDEAKSLVPWRTVAEFAWRPEDYDPDAALARALAIYDAN